VILIPNIKSIENAYQLILLHMWILIYHSKGVYGLELYLYFGGERTLSLLSYDWDKVPVPLDRSNGVNDYGCLYYGDFTSINVRYR
jgi:hypothetical protein